MVILNSPEVIVNEIDDTIDVVGLSTATGAVAGVFRWGPIGQRVLIDSEATLVSTLGQPTDFNFETWFNAVSFSAYSNSLQAVRAANTTGASPTVTANIVAGNTMVNVGNTSNLLPGMILVASGNDATIRTGTTISIVNGSYVSIATSSDAIANATGVSLQFIANTTVLNAFVNTAPVSVLTDQIVKTSDDFANKLEFGDFDVAVPYIAKWAGALGNSLKVSLCATENSFSSNVDLTNGGLYAGSISFNVDSNTSTVSVGALTSQNTGVNVNAINTWVTTVLQPNEFTAGDLVIAGNSVIGTQKLKIEGIGSVSQISLGSNSTVNVSISSGQANLTTTAGAFSAVNLGDQLVLWANTSYYETFKVANVISTNTVAVAVAPTFTVANGVWSKIDSPTATFTLFFDDMFKRSSNVTSNVVNRTWEYYDSFDQAPGQSNFVLNNGNTAAMDELHIVVVDELGQFSGVPGTVLEKWSNLSRATDASEDGNDNYFKTVINKGSKYIWVASDISGAPSANARNIASSSLDDPFTATFNYGLDGSDESSVSIGVLTDAYDQFASTESVDVSLILTGKSLGGSNGAQLANYLIDNIAEERLDCVVFVSPQKEDVVNNVGSEVDDIVAFRNDLRVSSYGFLDSGYKKMYDKYSDSFRYVPLNGDIAGLVARTERTNDAWWSPAGFNRGQIKNVINLAWNPRKAQRDILYKNSINPVVTFPGDGTILFGDKTLLSKPSAFDRINVRRLFIYLEKSIAKTARYTLFEFNDSFTRAQFRNEVVPFLRDIQGLRGIIDFTVICDDTNNTPQVIDENLFNADILVKPTRSINWISLNFYAVRTGDVFTSVARTVTV